MQLTWHGHSTWHVEVGETTFLIDPFFDNPKTALTPGDVDAPDYVLLTHGHADHIADVGAFAHDATVVGTPELVGYVESEFGGETAAPDAGDAPEAGEEAGGTDEATTEAEDAGESERTDDEEPEVAEPAEPADPPGDDADADDDAGDGEEEVEPDGGSSVDTIGMNLGGTVEAGDAHVTMHRADHTNGIDTGYEHDAGMPAGFVISTAAPGQSGSEEATTFYHAGDTALMTEMREVIGPYLDPDAAAVPIGDHFTMGPWQAALAVDWLDVDYAYPMHYDTFPPIEQDPADFRSEVQATGASTDVVIPEADEPFPL